MIVLAMLGLYVLRGLFNYMDRYWAHVAAYGALHRMTVGLYAHVQTLSARFFSDQKTGQLISRGIADMQAIESFIAHAVQMIVLSVSIPVGMIVVLFLLNWKLALLVFVPVPALFATMFWLTPVIRGLWRGVRIKLGEVTSIYQENLAGMSVIRSFTRESERVGELRGKSESFHRDIVRANKFTTVPNSAIEFIQGVGMVLLVWFGGRQATMREIMFFLDTHEHEHLGQMIAYARMNGITPPWTEEAQQRQQQQPPAKRP